MSHVILSSATSSQGFVSVKGDNVNNFDNHGHNFEILAIKLSNYVTL